MREFLRNLWTRAMLRGIHYRNQHSRFDQLYRIENPWHMDNEWERFRFEETNRLIQEHIGPVGSLLEIGCGEGHQTAKLAEVCTKIYAIDVSGRAVERATQRFPKAVFGVGDIFRAPMLASLRPFDLVVACEVLYYMSDVPAVLARMQELGQSCFVTYVGEQHGKLSPVLATIPNHRSTQFTHNGVHWYALWWHAQRDRQSV